MHATPSTGNDTTATLPDGTNVDEVAAWLFNDPEPTAVLGELTAAICARCPDDTARIMRAETLVALGHVEPPTTGTQWLVRSETDATRVYHATAHQCSCPDAQARERRCKHQYGVLLAAALEDELRYQARVAGEPIPYVLTGKAYAALQLPQPWPAPGDAEWRALCDAQAADWEPTPAA